MMPTASRKLGPVFAILGLLAVSACSSSPRPDAADWLPSWDALVATVPAESSIGSPPDAALCESTLGALRINIETVTPGPSPTVDDLVAEWISIAEAAFFECPPQGDPGSFAAAYDELARIENSVDAALQETS